MNTYWVTALTPFLVGDGYKLSPIDYMVWKDQVNVLDQSRIFKLLSKGPRLEGYLTQLKRVDKLDFDAWGGFAQNYAERRIPFEHGSLTRHWNEARPDQLFIPTFASGTRGPYLPGSALKGALKTAFTSSRWHAGTLREMGTRLMGDRPVRRPGEAAEAMTFGSANSDPLRGCILADSASVSNNVFSVYLARTATLESRGADRFQVAWKVTGGRSTPRPESATPHFLEMARPGTSFHGEIKVQKAGRVLQAANERAAALLDSQRKYAEQTGLERVGKSLDALLRILEEAKARRDACLINVGSGGGFLSKAGFLDTLNEDYRKVLGRLPEYERAIRSGLPFPKTRRIIFEQDTPSAMPGWVLFELPH